jgi:AcrR family transcriptional regulator
MLFVLSQANHVLLAAHMFLNSDEEAMTKAKPTSKKALTRARLLQTAASQMNIQGTASMDLQSVGRAAGMNRNALYYYFKNREDLVYQTYMRSAKQLADDLEIVDALSGSAADKLRALTQLHLSEDRSEQIVLKYLEVLNPAHRKPFAKLRRSNIEKLSLIFANGVASGEFREVNPAVVAQLTLGMMDWAQLWYRWTYESQDKAAHKRAQAASVIDDIILTGVYSGSSSLLIAPPAVESLSAKNLDVFDTESMTEHKKERLIGVASRLFSQKGVEPTSIDDVAAAVNATKGAVYHYFENKHELLMACYERTFALFELIISSAESLSGESNDTLALILHFHCQANAGSYPPLVPQLAMSMLPEEYSQRVLNISNRLWLLQRESVKEKRVKISSPAVVDLSLGASTWVHHWLEENPSVSARSLADQICSIFSLGIQPRN